MLYETTLVVNANWNAENDGWNVNANSVQNPNRWNAGNQVVSRHYQVSPQNFNGGVFITKPFFQPPSSRPTSMSCCKNSE